MPELPEVETVVRDLRPFVIGRRIDAVRRTSDRALRRPWNDAWTALLVGCRIERIDRRGKWIEMTLRKSEDVLYLLTHLGMTGQLTVVDEKAERLDHTHIVLRLDDGAELRYRDIRRFGSMTLYSTREEVEAFHREQALGPEPFGLDPSYWREKLAETTRMIKAVLLDQSVVSGVGNIYADESLFLARIHPTRRADELSRVEADRLRKAIAQVLNNAIEHRGSTIRNYVGGSGLRGEFQDEFRVYGRTGEACTRCKSPIECLRLGGRSSHFCPHCQPAK